MSAPMTTPPSELAARLEELLEKATPGPYSVAAFNEVFAGEPSCAAMILAGDGESIVAQNMKDADAESFAEILSALPALLASKEMEGRVTELIEGLETIAQMTDADDPESYRSDDREGCLDTVYAVANEAAKSARQWLAGKGDGS